jgi:polyisoprenoid-binding protein YceI
MKNYTVKLMTILFIGLSVMACKKAENKVEATDAEEVTQIEDNATRYVAEVDSSTVKWKGFAPTKSHNGTIKISEGYLALNEGKLSGGNFVIDMKSIVNKDLDSPEWNEKLVNHLYSADFFDVENNPYSVFAITGVDEKDGKIMVKGNLTVKNIKKNIEFPASVVMNGEEVILKSEPFTIDRTEWDVKYNSGKFFENLKDKLINDEIEFVIEVNAKKS